MLRAVVGAWAGCVLALSIYIWATPVHFRFNKAPMADLPACMAGHFPAGPGVHLRPYLLGGQEARSWRLSWHAGDTVYELYAWFPEHQ